MARAYQTIATLDPNDPDLQPPAPAIGKLTERECAIRQFLAKDYTAEEVAEILIISYHTVRSHLENIRAKLGARYTASAVAIALRTNQIQ